MCVLDEATSKGGTPERNPAAPAYGMIKSCEVLGLGLIVQGHAFAQTCMYACMQVGMYVCMYLSTRIHVYI